jgi:HlyD family secretion protein
MKIYVKTDVDENDIGKVLPGQAVTIKVDALPNQVFDGEVLKIAPQGKATQNVTTFEVTTELVSEDISRLKPGMNAEVEIMAASAQNVLLVPNEAIMNFGGRQMVRVVGEERPRRVEVGASNWEKTEIISGLDEGEVVVISGGSGPGGGGMDGFQRFRERMRRDPSAGVRMMRPPGGGRR